MYFFFFLQSGLFISIFNTSRSQNADQKIPGVGVPHPAASLRLVLLQSWKHGKSGEERRVKRDAEKWNHQTPIRQLKSMQRRIYKMPTESVRLNNNDIELNLDGHFRWASYKEPPTKKRWVLSAVVLQFNDYGS